MCYFKFSWKFISYVAQSMQLFILHVKAPYLSNFSGKEDAKPQETETQATPEVNLEKKKVHIGLFARAGF